jgi:hypothetical protein
VINPEYTAALKRPKEEKIIPNTISDEVRSRATFLKQTSNFIKKWKLDDPSRLINLAAIFSGKEREAKMDLQTLKNSLVYSFAGSTFTYKIVQMFDEMLDPGIFTAWDPVIYKIKSLRGEAKDNILRTVKQYPKVRNSLLEEDENELKSNKFDQSIKAWELKRKQTEGGGGPPVDWKPGTSGMMGS